MQNYDRLVEGALAKAEHVYVNKTPFTYLKQIGNKLASTILLDFAEKWDASDASKAAKNFAFTDVHAGDIICDKTITFKIGVGCRDEEGRHKRFKLAVEVEGRGQLEFNLTRCFQVPGSSINNNLNLLYDHDHLDNDDFAVFVVALNWLAATCTDDQYDDTPF